MRTMLLGCMAILGTALAWGNPLFPMEGPSGERIYGLGKITALDYSPTGEHFATASPIGAFIWNVETGAIEHGLQTGSDEPTALRFSPDGQQLVLTTFAGTVQVWDVETGERLRDWQAHDGPIVSMDAAREANILATGGGMEDNRVHWWNYSTGELLRSDAPAPLPYYSEFNGENPPVIKNLSLSPNGQNLLLQTEQVAWINIHEATPVHEYVERFGLYSESLSGVYINDDYFMISPSTLVSVTDRVEYSAPFSLHAESDYRFYSPHLMSANRRSATSDPFFGSYRFLNSEGAPFFNTLVTTGSIRTAVHPPSMQAISQESRQTLRRRIITPGETLTLQEYYGHSGAANDLVFTDDIFNGEYGFYTFGGFYDEPVRRWNRIGRYTLDPTPAELSNEFTFVPFFVSHYENMEVTAAAYRPHHPFGYIGFVGLHQVHGFSYFDKRNLDYTRINLLLLEESPVRIHQTAIGAFNIPPDPEFNETLGVILGDNTGRLSVLRHRFGTSGHVRIRNTELHTHKITSVVSSMDDRIIYSSDATGRISLWDWQRNRLEDVILPSYGTVESVAVHPDDTLLAAGGHNGIQVYDMQAGELRYHVYGHEGFVNDVAFSPDGSLLASAGQDGLVLVWESATGQLLTRLEGHVREVNAVAFSPDGNDLGSVGNDGTTRLWNLDEHTAIKHWRIHANN